MKCLTCTVHVFQHGPKNILASIKFGLITFTIRESLGESLECLQYVHYCIIYIANFFLLYFVKKLDISELVAKRMDAQRRLQGNPNDIEALLTLQEIQMKMQNWCQSNVKPGQYTGELVKNLLPKENLQGGFQAWVKKVLSFF